MWARVVVWARTLFQARATQECVGRSALPPNRRAPLLLLVRATLKARQDALSVILVTRTTTNCAELTQDEEQENMATIIGQQWLKILLIKYEKYENSKSGQTLGSKTLGYALVFIPEVLGYFTYMSKLIT